MPAASAMRSELLATWGTKRSTVVDVGRFHAGGIVRSVIAIAIRTVVVRVVCRRELAFSFGRCVWSIGVVAVVGGSRNYGASSGLLGSGSFVCLDTWVGAFPSSTMQWLHILAGVVVVSSRHSSQRKH